MSGKKTKKTRNHFRGTDSCWPVFKDVELLQSPNSPWSGTSVFLATFLASSLLQPYLFCLFSFPLYLWHFLIFFSPPLPFLGSREEEEEEEEFLGVFFGLWSKIRASFLVPESRTVRCSPAPRSLGDTWRSICCVFFPVSPLTVSHSLPQWDYAFREAVIMTDCNFVRGADHRFSGRCGGRKGWCRACNFCAMWLTVHSAASWGFSLLKGAVHEHKRVYFPLITPGTLVLRLRGGAGYCLGTVRIWVLVSMFHH